MGVTSFIKVLEQRFVEEARKHPRPDGLDLDNVEAVRSYLWERFAIWFVQNRDELLAEEWLEHGWVDLQDGQEDDRTVEQSPLYQVREDALEEIEAWLNDEYAATPCFELPGDSS